MVEQTPANRTAYNPAMAIPQTFIQELIARADVVIDTDGLLRETEEQVFAAWTLLGSGEAPSL